MAGNNDEHWQEMTSRIGQQKRHLSHVPISSIKQTPPIRKRRTASEQINLSHR
jgi:hypothetical protein